MVINKKRLALLIVLVTGVSVTVFHFSKKPSTSQVMIKNIDSYTQKNIMFDLGGVLFDADKFWALKTISKEIGFRDMVKYAYRTHKNPLNVLTVTLDFLDTFNPTSKDKYYKTRLLPELIVDWQIGKVTNQQALAIIDEQLHALQDPTVQRVTGIATRYVFVPEKFAAFLKPFSGIQVLQAFAQKKDKNGKPYHRIFLLSNFENATLDILKAKYPEVFALFNGGLVISENVGHMKPDKEIYQHILENYQLDPKDCLFIDDQIENVTGGEANGIESIHFIK